MFFRYATLAIFTVFALIATTSCATVKVPTDNVAVKAKAFVPDPSEKAKNAAEDSFNSTNRGKAKNYAKSGIAYAEECLKEDPNNPHCLYWHAINTGLYYRFHIIGYQRGVKKMIEDLTRVIELEPSYDNAGAYRVLGQLFTQLPQTGGSPESIIRDLDTAEKYLKLAVKISPDYPENHIALAEVLLAKSDYTEANESLKKATELAVLWKHDNSYKSWNHSMINLKKKINHATK